MSHLIRVTERASRLLRNGAIVVAMGAGLSLAACEKPYECKDEIGCVAVKPDEPIKIGVIQALSGKVEPSGHRYLRSTESAIDDRKGEMLGHKIVIQAEDGQCTREGGATAGLKIAADPQIIGVIGTTCSGEAKGAEPALSNAGMVTISGSNTAASLTSIGGEQGEDWHPGYFRTAHNDAEQGKAAAAFAFHQLNIRKVATIDDGDTYTKGLARVFREAFTELGGEVVLTGAINKGDTDIAPVLISVHDSGAELLFLALFEPEGDLVIQQKAKDAALAPIKVMSSDGLMLGTFLETVGKDSVGMYFVGPAKASGADYDAFVSKYEAKYGEQLTTNFHAQTYDAANMLMAAVEKVAVKGSDGTIHIGRKALRDALYATKDFPGLTGKLSCNQFGDCGAVRFIGVQVEDPASGIDGLKSKVLFTYP
ncbi:MAG: branched-chain amino acid ABC transporter substrate-binding protein [Dongiaceae bacterium]